MALFRQVNGEFEWALEVFLARAMRGDVFMV